MEGTVVYEHKKIRKERKNVAIFDVDWTIIKPNGGRRFPKDVTDWQWFRASVPEVIRRYHKKGYRIVLLTDQTKDWKVDMIKNVAQELDVPLLALIAMKKEIQKPNPAFFRSIFANKDLSDSVYVGDAAGRPGDWADVDKVVAERLKVPFLTPEEAFP